MNLFSLCKWGAAGALFLTVAACNSPSPSNQGPRSSPQQERSCPPASDKKKDDSCKDQENNTCTKGQSSLQEETCPPATAQTNEVEEELEREEIAFDLPPSPEEKAPASLVMTAPEEKAAPLPSQIASENEVPSSPSPEASAPQ